MCECMRVDVRLGSRLMMRMFLSYNLHLAQPARSKPLILAIVRVQAEDLLDVRQRSLLVLRLPTCQRGIDQSRLVPL